ncbi:hypothetical protein KSB_48460 [Ktedonobacter robiniae]|uniref:Uncharacterized protein n=1 Tax=Ktedonobacter robiniae TaxID=2778365 RepID=A0ABQ3UUK1_9CHLR|nr:hypothetical protein KSB_48460 [Ktedonobacter robiniae]
MSKRHWLGHKSKYRCLLAHVELRDGAHFCPFPLPFYDFVAHRVGNAYGMRNEERESCQAFERRVELTLPVTPVII